VTTEFLVANIDGFGTPESYNHYAWAGRTPWTPLPVDQAGRLALGGHAQRDDRALAARYPRERRIRASSIM